MIIKEKNIKNLKSIDELNKKIICGETLSLLKKIPDKSIPLIITSPSYFLGKSYEKNHEFDEYINEHSEIIIEEYQGSYSNIMGLPKEDIINILPQK